MQSLFGSIYKDDKEIASLGKYLNTQKLYINDDSYLPKYYTKLKMKLYSDYSIFVKQLYNNK